MVAGFAQALRARPGLRLIAVIPSVPEQDGPLTLPMNLIGRITALAELRRAGGDRVAVYGLENRAGTPVYVHAKVCVIDDVWASVGSDNINLRSWTHDSELSCAVLDEAGAFARELRLELMREHLDAPDALAAQDGLHDPVAAFDAFARTAATLDAWYDNGRPGPPAPGAAAPVRAAGPAPVAAAARDPAAPPAGRPGGPPPEDAAARHLLTRLLLTRHLLHGSFRPGPVTRSGGEPR